MATTSYCLRADVEAVLSIHGVNRSVDDDFDGEVEAFEELYVTNSIERAASRINARIQKRYTLSALSSNDWMTFTNATMAAQLLMRRRGNGVPPSIDTEVDELLSDLDEIKAGTLDIPEQRESLEYTPTVSNYTVQRGQVIPAVRVNTRTSTGGDPNSTLKRFNAIRHHHHH